MSYDKDKLVDVMLVPMITAGLWMGYQVLVNGRSVTDKDLLKQTGLVAGVSYGTKVAFEYSMDSSDFSELQKRIMIPITSGVAYSVLKNKVLSDNSALVTNNKMFDYNDIMQVSLASSSATYLEKPIGDMII